VSRRAFIDTQVALWLAKGDARVSSGTLKWLNSNSETVMSALSIAELEIKAGIGKLALPKDFAELFLNQGIKIEAFSQESAASLSRFPSLVRHDPFDRMILAQAAAKSSTTFFTADRALVAHGLDWVVDCAD
jgi:PIN domain nuclease of toxin-antitoxin system